MVVAAVGVVVVVVVVPALARRPLPGPPPAPLPPPTPRPPAEGKPYAERRDSNGGVKRAGRAPSAAAWVADTGPGSGPGGYRGACPGAVPGRLNRPRLVARKAGDLAIKMRLAGGPARPPCGPSASRLADKGCRDSLRAEYGRRVAGCSETLPITGRFGDLSDSAAGAR